MSRVTIASIKAATAEYYQIPRRVIDGHFGARITEARPRQVAMYLARRLTNHSRNVIGQHFGGRDPTTIFHAEHRIRSLIFADSTTRRAVWRIAKALHP